MRKNFLGLLRCREAAIMLSQAQDRRLSTTETVRLKIHVGLCGACNQFGKQLKWMSLYAKRYAENGADESKNKNPS